MSKVLDGCFTVSLNLVKVSQKKPLEYLQKFAKIGWVESHNFSFAKIIFSYIN